jgi:hypothetical protein
MEEVHLWQVVSFLAEHGCLMKYPEGQLEQTVQTWMTLGGLHALDSYFPAKHL